LGKVMREARRLSRATATDVEKTQTHPAEAAVFDIYRYATGIFDCFDAFSGWSGMVVFTSGIDSLTFVRHLIV